MFYLVLLIIRITQLFLYVIFRENLDLDDGGMRELSNRRLGTREAFVKMMMKKFEDQYTDTKSFR